MADQSPVQRAYRNVVHDIGDGLRERGFKGSDQSFHLRDDAGSFVVGFKEDKYSTRDKIKFTINLGFGVRALYDRYPWPQEPNTPSLDHCHFVQRVGWYNYHRAVAPITKQTFFSGIATKVHDVWWTIERPGDADDVIPQVRSLLLDVALPEVLKWRDRDTFTAHLETLCPDTDSYKAWIIEALGADAYIEPPGMRMAG